MASSKYKTLKQVERNIRQKHLASKLSPSHLEWNLNAPNKVIFSDGSVCPGTCIECVETPCMKFLGTEISLQKLTQFPSDHDTDVCPTKAISWPYESASPVIDDSLCVGCGLCAARCPTKAIFFKDNGSASVNNIPNKYFIENSTDSDNRKTQDTVTLFQNLKWKNPILQDSEQTLDILFKKYLDESSSLFGNEPNLLIRNLLITVGVKSAIRRTGDTNIRMDIVLEDIAHNLNGIGEIEFGIDILNTPRNTLDNIAVFTSRYKIDNLIPIVFPLVLPNQRSEYWQVMKDIKNVLKIKIRTVTLGALLLLLWNQAKISLGDLNNFYSDADNFSIRQALENLLHRKINISDGYLGIIEPQK